jgi:ATP-dependent Zn protease
LKLKKSTRSFLLLLGAILAAAVFLVLSLPRQKVDQVALSTLINEAKNGKITSIDVDGNRLTATIKDSSANKQFAYKDSSSASIVKDYGIDSSKVKINTNNPDPGSNIWLQIGLTIAPFLLVIAFLYFLTRQAQGQATRPRTSARAGPAWPTKVTFEGWPAPMTKQSSPKS